MTEFYVDTSKLNQQAADIATISHDLLVIRSGVEGVKGGLGSIGLNDIVPSIEALLAKMTVEISYISSCASVLSSIASMYETTEADIKGVNVLPPESFGERISRIFKETIEEIEELFGDDDIKSWFESFFKISEGEDTGLDTGDSDVGETRGTRDSIGFTELDEVNTFSETDNYESVNKTAGLSALAIDDEMDTEYIEQFKVGNVVIGSAYDI